MTNILFATLFLDLISQTMHPQGRRPCPKGKEGNLRYKEYWFKGDRVGAKVLKIYFYNELLKPSEAAS
jgi:hypothetical protein